MASDVAEFLDAVCQDLADNGKTSRDLVALEFDVETAKIDALTREERHEPQYPELATILGTIGRNCDADGIAVHQLRRITFLEEEVNLELIDDDGEPMVYSYQIVKPDLDS